LSPLLGGAKVGAVDDRPHRTGISSRKVGRYRARALPEVLPVARLQERREVGKKQRLMVKHHLHARFTAEHNVPHREQDRPVTGQKGVR
jgi:hypothetical protein